MSSGGKLQPSNFKLEGSSKSQIPNPKKIPTSKSQKDPKTGFEIWSLRFVIFLGFGIWDFGSLWSLEPDVWRFSHGCQSRQRRRNVGFDHQHALVSPACDASPNSSRRQPTMEAAQSH